MNVHHASRLAVSVVVPPRACSAWIRLVGEVEMSAEPQLAAAVHRMSRLAPGAVVVDLSAVTFVCSTLANFVAELHGVVPDASLIMRNPSRMARLVLTVSGLDTVVTISEGTASGGTAPGDPEARG